MKRICIILSLCVSITVCAQNVAINNDGSLPHPNSMLDIKGVNKGLLIPRGDAATRTSLNTNLAKGLMIYDTTSQSIWIHNGDGTAAGWTIVSNGFNHWFSNGAAGNEIRNINSGGFWSANAFPVYSESLTVPPASGAGTRFFWMPPKSAFRVGTVDGNDWNADSIGTWSTGIGFNTRAKGAASVAMGTNSIATGYTAFSVGYATNASGGVSVAMGNFTNARGQYSMATGNFTNANGQYSTATGHFTSANGQYSLTSGGSTTANGDGSVAFGASTYALGLTSFTHGLATRASGDNSVAFGSNTVARAYNSFAIGQYNDSAITACTNCFFNDNPLFYIGNGTGSSNRNNAMAVYLNGNMVLKNASLVNSDPAGYTLPVTGTGTRMMWLPEKSALRMGSVYSTQWDASNIGLYSFAGGLNTVATGISSFAYGQGDSALGNSSVAMGFGTKTTGDGAVALGSFSEATGGWSFAVGNGAVATNTYSIAMGGSTISSGGSAIAMGFEAKAFGNQSVSLGYNNLASGIESVAIGRDNTATAASSIAMGKLSTASGVNSFAMGNSTYAAGNNSMAMGISNSARAYGSVAIGRFNDSIVTSNRIFWVATDPLLYLGNGTSDAARSNAVVIYKNGNTDIGGYTQLGKTTDGAPAIKMKKLTGTSANVDGGDASIAHGLTRAKILGIQVLLEISPAGGGTDVPPSYLDAPGYEYHTSVTGTNIMIYLKPGNCVNVINKPVRVLVTYEE